MSMTPEEIELWEEHERAVAQQRRDRDELADKEVSDAEWDAAIEQRWGNR